MTIKAQILDLFKDYNELSVKEITDKTGASKQMVHLILAKLLNEGKVLKMGRTPKTVYHFISKPEAAKTTSTLVLTDKENEFLNANFIVVTETGNLLHGIEAFEHWCLQRKLPVQKTFDEFLLTKKKYNQYYNKQGLVNGTEKVD